MRVCSLASKKQWFDKLLAGFLISCVSWTAKAEEPQRNWVSRDRKSVVEATLTGLSGDNRQVVLLRAADRKKVQVPINKLSPDDISYLWDYQHRIRFPDIVSLARPSVEKDAEGDSDRWNLRPAVAIRLPEGCSDWRVLSEHPVAFGCFAQPTDSLPVMQVVCSLSVTERDGRDRSRQINLANLATRFEMSRRGVQQPEGLFLTDATGSNTLRSRVYGSRPDDSILVCETHLWHTGDTWLSLRAFGSQDEVVKLVQAIQQAVALEIIPAGSVTSTDRSVPFDVRRDFQEFVDRALALLEAKGNAKEVLQSLLSADDWQRLNQDAVAWKAAIEGFDSRKRARLFHLLESLKWESSEYSKEQQTLSFQEPGRAVFQKTGAGWRMKN